MNRNYEDLKRKIALITQSSKELIEAMNCLASNSKIETLKELFASHAIEISAPASRLINDANVVYLNSHESHRKNLSRDHLQLVSFDGLSARQIRLIERGQPKSESWYSRSAARDVILKYLKDEYNRRAKIIVSYVEAEKIYLMEINRSTGEKETHRIPYWDSYGVRGKIDDEKKHKVPWTQIKSGTSWTADVELSPYYLEDTWTPQNVIPFKLQNPAIVF